MPSKIRRPYSAMTEEQKARHKVAVYKWRAAHMEVMCWTAVRARRTEEQRQRSLEYQRAWKKRTQYELKRYHSDPQYRISSRLRCQIRQALRGTLKSKAVVALVGCPIDFLKAHFTAQFAHGMSWDNWGERWEIDHIRPLCGFNLTDPCAQREACHYTNLRPLSKEDNRRKAISEKRKEFKTCQELV